MELMAGLSDFEKAIRRLLQFFPTSTQLCYKATMNRPERLLLVGQFLLLLTACLFMFALLVRQLQIPQYDLAHTAQRIVLGYAHHPWTLWVLLIALPLSVLVIGCAALLCIRAASGLPGEVPLGRTPRRNRPARSPFAALRLHPALLFIAAATLAAAAVLAVVVVHMLMN